MQGEMQSKDEKLSNLELTNSKMSDKCKVSSIFKFDLNLKLFDCLINFRFCHFIDVT